MQPGIGLPWDAAKCGLSGWLTTRDAAQDRVMAARVDKHRVRLRVGIDAPGNPLD